MTNLLKEIAVKSSALKSKINIGFIFKLLFAVSFLCSSYYSFNNLSIYLIFLFISLFILIKVDLTKNFLIAIIAVFSILYVFDDLISFKPESQHVSVKSVYSHLFDTCNKSTKCDNSSLNNSYKNYQILQKIYDSSYKNKMYTSEEIIMYVNSLNIFYINFFKIKKGVDKSVFILITNYYYDSLIKIIKHNKKLNPSYIFSKDFKNNSGVIDLYIMLGSTVLTNKSLNKNTLEIKEMIKKYEFIVFNAEQEKVKNND